MIPAETLPMFMETAKAYTDKEIAQLEQRLTERIAGSESRLSALVEEKLRQHRTEIDGIEANISTTLLSVSSDISDMKISLSDWKVRAQALRDLDMDVRDLQGKQTVHAEALTTLQSDLYGLPDRGRETLFGMMKGLTNEVKTLASKVGSQSQWIEEETQRQAEARQRWQNRQQAALQLVRVIPVKAITAAVGIGGTALFVFLKAIGG